MVSKNYEKYNFSFLIFVVVYATHNYLFLNRIINVDYLGDTEFEFSQLLLGRFMPLFIFRILPSALSVLISLLVTLSIMMIVSIFEIKSPIFVLALAIILGTFPSLAYSFTYVFYAERIGIALCCSVFSVFLTLKVRRKIGFILGGVSLAISLGEYQSYIGVSICLALAYIIIMIIEKIDWKEILRRSLQLLLMGLIGTSIYLIVLKICLRTQGVQLANYRGVGQLGNINWVNLPKQFVKAYINFYCFLIGDSYFTVGIVQDIIWLLLLATLLVSIGIIFKKNFIHGFVLFLAIFLLPAGVFVVDIISPDANTNAMQIYQMAIVLVLPLIIIYKTDFLQVNFKFKKYIVNSVIVISFILGITYYYYDNAYYVRAAAYSEQTTLLLNRVWSRVEEIEEFAENTKIPILVLMDMQPLYGQKLPIYKDYIKYDVGYIDRFVTFNQFDSMIGTSKFARLVYNKIGVEIKEAKYEQMLSVLNSPEYLSMSTWPDKSSIKVINGILVVNFATVISSEITEENDRVVVKAKTNQDGVSFAFYLYKNGEQVHTQWYDKSDTFVFPKKLLDNAKNYQIEIFCQDEEGKFLGKKIMPLINIE